MIKISERALNKILNDIKSLNVESQQKRLHYYLDRYYGSGVLDGHYDSNLGYKYLNYDWDEIDHIP